MFDQKELDRIKKETEKAKREVEDGPWMKEPDRMEFKHAGFDCLIQRGPITLAWCGYVGLPKDHPYYGMDYDDTSHLRVHGGLTYASPCQGSICHITEENDVLFWFGFDCAHANDVAPALHMRKGSHFAHYMKHSGNFKPQYRDMNYVIAQTKQLAEQLRKAA